MNILDMIGFSVCVHLCTGAYICSVFLGLRIQFVALSEVISDYIRNTATNILSRRGAILSARRTHILSSADSINMVVSDVIFELT